MPEEWWTREFISIQIMEYPKLTGEQWKWIEGEKVWHLFGYRANSVEKCRLLVVDKIVMEFYLTETGKTWKSQGIPKNNFAVSRTLLNLLYIQGTLIFFCLFFIRHDCRVKIYISFVVIQKRNSSFVDCYSCSLSFSYKSTLVLTMSHSTEHYRNEVLRIINTQIIGPYFLNEILNGKHLLKFPHFLFQCWKDLFHLMKIPIKHIRISVSARSLDMIPLDYFLWGYLKPLL